MQSDSALKSLSRLLSVVGFYEDQLTAAGSWSAQDAMDLVAREIEKEGVHGIGRWQDVDDPP